jgi:hypothetical protein
MTGDTFVKTFVQVAREYGQKRDVEMMSKWTEAGVRSVFKAVASADVIISAWDFVLNYFLNNTSQVVFNWEQVPGAQSSGVSPSGTPRPTQSSGSADEQMASVAFEMTRAVYTLDFATIVALVDDPNGYHVWLPGVTRVVPEYGEEWLWSPAGFSTYCAQHEGKYNNCTMYEIGSITETERNCKDASAAEALNGYGRTCLFRFALAVREVSATGFVDTYFNVRTQMRASIPKVMAAQAY